MPKLKLTKVKNKNMLIVDLHTSIYQNTNNFITIEIDKLCRKFIKELEKTLLSEDCRTIIK